MFVKIQSVLLPIVFAAGAAPATAHDEGRLVLARAAVAPGDTLGIEGLEFAPGKYRLRLRSALTTYDLPAVTASPQGTFRLTWVVPVQSQPGAYRLVALAADGDMSAGTALTILERRGDAASEATRGAHDARVGASPEPMPLERLRTPAEWAVILFLIAASFGGGLLLLRRA